MLDKTVQHRHWRLLFQSVDQWSQVWTSIRAGWTQQTRRSRRNHGGSLSVLTLEETMMLKADVAWRNWLSSYSESRRRFQRHWTVRERWEERLKVSTKTFSRPSRSTLLQLLVWVIINPRVFSGRLLHLNHLIINMTDKLINFINNNSTTSEMIMY